MEGCTLKTGRAARASGSWEEQETVSPWSLQEEPALRHLLSSEDLRQASGLQKHKRASPGCAETLNLWQFVTAARGALVLRVVCPAS